jgi:hypothetical protein
MKILHDKLCLKAIGLWRDFERNPLIHPLYIKNELDFKWNEIQISKLCKNLSNGIIVGDKVKIRWYTHVEKKIFYLLTNGEWLWSSHLVDYIKDYRIGLPENFINDMLKNDLKDYSEIKKYTDQKNYILDFQEWKTWCAERMINPQLIGYWESNYEEEKLWIHPKHIRDFAYDKQEKEKLVDYLKNGLEYASYLGYSHCRFKDGPDDIKMGTSDLTDGHWIWPEGLYIYIDKYNVELPAEFLAHVKKNDYKIQENVYFTAFDGMIGSSKFWDAWCKNKKKELNIQ